MPSLVILKDRLIQENISANSTDELSALTALVCRLEENVISRCAFPKILYELIENIHMPCLEKMDREEIILPQSTLKNFLEGVLSFKLYAAIYSSVSKVSQLNDRIEKFLTAKPIEELV